MTKGLGGVNQKAIFYNGVGGEAGEATVGQYVLWSCQSPMNAMCWLETRVSNGKVCQAKVSLSPETRITQLFIKACPNT